METNKVKQIHDLGQSIWLDFFDRKIMNNGELQQLMDEDGLTGITSNPSIFEKAVASSGDYDEDIRTSSGEQKSNEDIFFAFAISATFAARFAPALSPATAIRLASPFSAWTFSTVQV